MEKLKKDSQAFLYFRENSKGALNIKFGPEKFSTDTKKFTEILLTGNLHCMTFLSNLTKQEPLDFRTRQYENLKLNYHAILDQAFEDVYEEKKRIYQLEELAIERVEKGDTVSPEFEKKVSEAKEDIAKRSNQKTFENKKEEEEKFRVELEKNIEALEKTRILISNIMGIQTMGFVTGDENDEKSDAYEVVIRLIDDEIQKNKQAYMDLEEGRIVLV
ncbi:MAG: hypothetical protein EOM53_05605 [Alphaproteobacteria bacterium]|nr:hypothetical protein [Alphaproteobacteria bacterium]